MYSESPRSMGASVKASINNRTKASTKMISIANEMKIASSARDIIVSFLKRIRELFRKSSSFTILIISKIITKITQRAVFVRSSARLKSPGFL